MLPLEPLTATPLQRDHARAMVAMKRCIDRSDAGSGKTLVAIEAMTDANKSRHIVICPTIVRAQWAARLRAQRPEWRVHEVKSGRDWCDLMHTDVIVVTYGLARAPLMRDYLRDWKPEVIVLDEAHNLKNAEAKTTEAIYGARGIAEDAEYIFALTATPVRRYADDLFPHLKALNPSSIKIDGSRYTMSLQQFRDKFCIQELRRFGGGRPTKIVVGNQNMTELKDAVHDISVYRSLREMAGELPSTTRSALHVKVPDQPVISAVLRDHPELRDFYVNHDRRDIEDKLADMLANEETYLPTVRKVIALEKASDPLLCEYLREQDKVVVFAWHREAIERLMVGLYGDVKAGYIDGGTSARIREDTLQRFVSGDMNVLVLQIEAAGTGLDGLQKVCHKAVFLERDWSPALNEQAEARLRRIGQEYPVHIEEVTSDNLIDNMISDVINRKSPLMEELK